MNLGDEIKHLNCISDAKWRIIKLVFHVERVIFNDASRQTKYTSELAKASSE